MEARRATDDPHRYATRGVRGSLLVPALLRCFIPKYMTLDLLLYVINNPALSARLYEERLLLNPPQRQPHSIVFSPFAMHHIVRCLSSLSPLANASPSRSPNPTPPTMTQQAPPLSIQPLKDNTLCDTQLPRKSGAMDTNQEAGTSCALYASTSHSHRLSTSNLSSASSLGIRRSWILTGNTKHNKLLAWIAPLLILSLQHDTKHKNKLTTTPEIGIIRVFLNLHSRTQSSSHNEGGSWWLEKSEPKRLFHWPITSHPDPLSTNPSFPEYAWRMMHDSKTVHQSHLGQPHATRQTKGLCTRDVHPSTRSPHTDKFRTVSLKSVGKRSSSL